VTDKVATFVICMEMGACLCKDALKSSNCQDSQFQSPASLEDRDCSSSINGHEEDLWSHGSYDTCQDTRPDQQLVNSLVLETLNVIRTLVENEQDPPASLMRLHNIADNEEGWLQLVLALVDVIPLGDPLGPAVMTLLLDDCPLPTVETAKRCLDLIDRLSEAEDSLENVTKHRNITIVLGCLAEKLAGPRSVELLNKKTLDFLISNLDPDRPPPIILFSLIALEKFSQTSENKVTLAKKFKTFLSDHHPLMILETRFLYSSNFVSRQVGFCSQWCLDNLFPVENRNYTYTVIDTSHINMMLNSNDVSEYLKIGPNGLEARCDASSFESVRCTFSVSSGQWYYEVELITCGVMQIGWATKESKFLNHEGYGIGDDEHSQAYDGCRQLMWFNASCESQDKLPQWKAGDIVGCFIDIDNKSLSFSLNGEYLSPFNQVFQSTSSGFFPAASFMSFQQCEFNFGWKPFKFPPQTYFQSFNQVSKLSKEEKIILPRPMKMEAMKRLSVKENACTLCFDQTASMQLFPCRHKGFCSDCCLQLDICPMCRSPIESKRNVTDDSSGETSPLLNPTHGVDSLHLDPGESSPLLNSLNSHSESSPLLHSNLNTKDKTFHRSQEMSTSSGSTKNLVSKSE